MKQNNSIVIFCIALIFHSSCKKDNVQPTNQPKQKEAVLMPAKTSNFIDKLKPVYHDVAAKVSGMYDGDVYGHCEGDVCGDMAHYGEGTATVTRISEDTIEVTAAYSSNLRMVYSGITAYNNSYYFRGITIPSLYADVYIYFKVDSNNISFHSSDYCSYAFYGSKH